MKEIKAIWKPVWYELDQTLEVGVTDKFYLDQSQNPAKFTTGLDQEGDGIEATILTITHSQLGEIKRIDTSGLSYKFYLVSNSLVQIEAEERPGFIEEGLLKGKNLSNLIFEVRLLLL